VCCSVLQCVAVCCGVLQCVAVCCNVLQWVAMCCTVLHTLPLCNCKQRDSLGSLSRSTKILSYVSPCLSIFLHYNCNGEGGAKNCNTLQCIATHCNALQCTATNGNTLQYTATHCNTLQHTATHCNTLQHTATDSWFKGGERGVRLHWVMSHQWISHVTHI